jgi:hypothetical protein
MKKPLDEEQLRVQAKALFDDSVEQLDAATLSRLNQGRQKALQETQTAGPAGQWARWVPAGGLAAARSNTARRRPAPQRILKFC